MLRAIYHIIYVHVGKDNYNKEKKGVWLFPPLKAVILLCQIVEGLHVLFPQAAGKNI